MPYKKLVKQSVPEEIVEEILRMIQRGELKPGDLLPTERELMAQMDVSRSSVREAMRALSVMNVITIRQGHGTRVTSLEPGLLMEHLEFALSLEDVSLLHLFEVRKIIEVACAELAARRIKDDEIPKLEAVMALQSLRDIDTELHHEIAEMTKNPILQRIYASIERLSLMSRNRTGALPGVHEQARKDHGAIVTAIVHRDPAAAREAMLKHLQFVEKQLKEDLAARGATMDTLASANIAEVRSQPSQ